ncbi:hypothetical protein [Clostridium brassicae]|uniref:DUF1648 domain-containing protein n=1 Tax=Clostridium brassicae TaxID=2999072 RepID=A0ABT4D9L9_9CLOT|nr:hypothetical protein [Clostridium brassicae]MCY6957724.1 hypothetical protein [Clostridium brassicae]
MKNGFTKIFWGFLFIMINFRITGFDILPDPIGYLLFFIGFKELSSKSNYFIKGRNCSIIMVILSIFTIYQTPPNGKGAGLIKLGVLEKFIIPISIIVLIIGIYIVYNLFMGVKEMCHQQENTLLYDEAEDLWRKYIYLTIGIVFLGLLIHIPLIAILFAIVLAIASIILAVKIMKFIKKCESVLI